MLPEQPPIINEDNYQEVIRLLTAGKFRDAEELVFRQARAVGAATLAQAMREVADSQAGRDIVTSLQDTYHYRSCRKTEVQVTVVGEQRIRVPSYYALAPSKKMGRPKKGRNGTGTHVLLSYWGFTRKRSPGSLNEIVRAGSASASYELATEQLQAQGITVSAPGVSQLVQHVGGIAEQHRADQHLALMPGESLAGKRVSIGLDGGRITLSYNQDRPAEERSPSAGL